MDFASEAEKFSQMPTPPFCSPPDAPAEDAQQEWIDVGRPPPRRAPPMIPPVAYDPIALLEWTARSMFKQENENCKRKIILQMDACDDALCNAPEKFVLDTYADMCTRAGAKPKDVKRDIKYVSCNRQKRVVTVVFATVNAANAFYSMYTRTQRTNAPGKRVYAFTDKPLAVRLAKSAYQTRISELQFANPQARLHWGNGYLYAGDELVCDLLPFIAPRGEQPCTC